MLLCPEQIILFGALLLRVASACVWLRLAALAPKEDVLPAYSFGVLS